MKELLKTKEPYTFLKRGLFIGEDLEDPTGIYGQDLYVITDPAWNKKLATDPTSWERFKTYMRIQDSLVRNVLIRKGLKSNCFYFVLQTL